MTTSSTPIPQIQLYAPGDSFPPTPDSSTSISPFARKKLVYQDQHDSMPSPCPSSIDIPHSYGSIPTDLAQCDTSQRPAFRPSWTPPWTPVRYNDTNDEDDQGLYLQMTNQLLRDYGFDLSPCLRKGADSHPVDDGESSLSTDIAPPSGFISWLLFGLCAATCSR